MTVPEPTFLDLAQAYFLACRQRAPDDRVDDLARSGRFQELRRRFRLIQEVPARSWFVATSDEARELWALWLRCRPELPPDELDADARQARRERAAVRVKFQEHVVQERIRTEGFVDAPELELLSAHRYHPELGLVPEEFSP